MHQWLDERRRSPFTDNAPRQAFGRQPCPVQSLAYIDIAKPGYNPLVQQGSLQGRPATGKGTGQEVRVQCIAERFHTETGEKPVAIDTTGFNQVNEAEPPRVGVDDPGAVIEINNQMVMRPITCMTCLLEIVKLAEIADGTIRWPDGKPAGHAQVNEHGMPAFQFDEDVLGAPPQRNYALA